METQVIEHPDLRRTAQAKGIVHMMLNQWDEHKKPVLTEREYAAFLGWAMFLRDLAESDKVW